jgi:glucokinase
MMEIFATSIANNILVTGSQKCVIICGGISAKLSNFFSDSEFFERLSNKGKYKNYVSDVPILLSFDNNNGLKGSAEAFYNPFFQSQKLRKI